MIGLEVYDDETVHDTAGLTLLLALVSFPVVGPESALVASHAAGTVYLEFCNWRAPDGS